MKKIMTNGYWLFFLLFPFFNPNALRYIPGLTVIYSLIQIWKLIACCTIIALYLFRGKLSKIVLLILLWEFISIGTSLLNGVSDLRPVTNALMVISLAMMTELSVKYNVVKYYRILLKIISTLVLINLILCVLYPFGLEMASLYTNTKNPMYFLGIDNGMVSNLIPFLFLICLLVFCDKNSNKGVGVFIVASLISVITIVIVGSATGLFVLIVNITFTVFFTILQKRKIPYRIALIVYCIFFVLVIVLQSSNFIVLIITELLGRSGTFTGRSLLWAAALEEIARRPLLGYGYTGGNIAIWGGAYSSHNMFLEMMIQGGVLYFAVFIIITYVAIKRINKGSVALGNTLFSGIYCFLLNGLMETGVSEIYFIFIVLAYYAKSVKIQLEEINKLQTVARGDFYVENECGNPSI